MKYISTVLLLFIPELTQAAGGGGERLELVNSWVGYTCIVVFVLAYLVVMIEEFTHLRKSKPVILAAGIIWALIAWVYAGHGEFHVAEEAARHNFLEFAELMLFLMVAMTYVNSMEERQVFNVLRAWMVSKGFSYRTIFWLTGVLSFFISPIADNLTTALLMCAVVMAVGRGKPGYISLSCVNIVVAANAGGAFSPFGDITTLMVWQKGIVDFWSFFHIFFPSVINWVVPAAIMSFWVEKGAPEKLDEHVELRYGAVVIMIFFLCTIVTAVSFHNFLHLPPVLGMMTGLAYLQIYGYWLRRVEHKLDWELEIPEEVDRNWLYNNFKPRVKPFDVFVGTKRAEWDTLLFFYGIVMCVGGLGMIGYLALVSEVMYQDWGPTQANIAVGVLSAIVDNIPVMFAVLTMLPDMSMGQWLLVTLTAGVGGSMLSIGSAAGVALMGQARGYYTFVNHLKWTPVIALGYAASIYAHLLINEPLFKVPI